MENNNLIPVWDELPMIKEVLRLKDHQPADELKLFEKAGKLKVIARQGDHFLNFEVKIPEEYPSAKPDLVFNEHNFDENFVKIYEAAANQILRRLWEGGEPGYIPGTKSDINKGKIGGQKNQGGLQYEMEKLKLLNRHELKHDVEYMNMAKNLREAAAEGDKKAKKFMKLKMKHES